jgi:catechol 2,3-dioxygenase-like lactoylglutathione lyase family enzyme
MKITAIDHVQLAMPVGGEDRARAFYSGLLQLDEKPKPPELAVRGGAWFENDLVKIHLGIESDFRSARKAHPALLVRDLPALIEILRAAGYEVLDHELAQYHRVYVSDPFDNRIELIAEST